MGAFRRTSRAAFAEGARKAARTMAGHTTPTVASSEFKLLIVSPRPHDDKPVIPRQPVIEKHNVEPSFGTPAAFTFGDGSIAGTLINSANGSADPCMSQVWPSTRCLPSATNNAEQPPGSF